VQNKMLLYYAQIHSNQLEYQDDRTIVKTITINLLDFNYLNSSTYLNKIVIPSKTENKIELYVLELPKFRTSLSKKITRQEAWMCYLCGEPQDIIEESLKRFSKIDRLNNLLEDYWKNEVME